MPIVLITQGPDAGRTVPVRGRMTIGRENTDLRLTDPHVSRMHAVLEVRAEGLFIADAGSTAGTRLAGRQVTTPVLMPAGAVVTLGQTCLQVVRPGRVSAAHAPVLHVYAGERPFLTAPLTGTAVLGRSTEADFSVDQPGLSRAHLEFSLTGGEVRVRDLGSTNGTLVNGRRLTGLRVLRSGDELEFPTTPVRARVTSGVATMSAREFRVSDSAGRDWAVQLSAPTRASIGAVAAALARYLGVDDRTWTLAHAGYLLHPDDLWDAAGIARGARVHLAWPVAEAGRHLRPPAPGRQVARHLDAPQRLIPHPVVVPPPPSVRTIQGLGWQLAAGALGLITGVVIGLATNNWLFAVLGGIAGLGAVVFGLLADRSRRVADLRQFRHQVAEADAEVTAAVASQLQVAHGRSPAPAVWREIVTGHGPPLWERRWGDVDFGRPALGVGDRPAVIECATTPRSDHPVVQSLIETLTAPRSLAAVPVLAPATGVLGVVGPRRVVSELVASLVSESALLHAPSELAIAVVADLDDWTGARWLPHALEDGTPLVAYDADSAAALIDRLVLVPPQRPTLVVVTAGLLTLARELASSWSTDRGLLVICADDLTELPAATTAVVEVTEREGRYTSGDARVDPLAPRGPFRPRTIPFAVAVRVALALADRIDPAGQQAAVPGGNTLLELLKLSGGDPAALEQLWRTEAGTNLRALLGRDDDGDLVELDFEADGPHAMVAGTTGSGKSEVLATILTSLIARYSPEQLALFLVDFKGGATMAQFAAAPHVVGIVTDIESDQQLAMRAFTALEAEINRRKRILAAAGVEKIPSYRAAGSPSGPLPSLVVVIDEFALLVSTQPAAKPRLDTVAAQGRSLGIHLILATQSPGGVVSPTIKANTNLWLALRVVGETESREIIDLPDAARLPVDAPGRGLLRRGGEPRLRSVRAARVTIAAESTAATWVTPFADHRPVLTAPAVTSSHVPSELAVVVHLAAQNASAQGYASPAQLWHPPMAHHLGPADVPDEPVAHGLSVLLGLGDDPATQSQRPYRVDLATGNLLITGGPGSGRSTALQQVAASLVRHRSAAEVHLYTITMTDSLAPCAQLPHVAGQAKVDDREMLLRVLDRLSTELTQRRSGVSSGARPHLVLLVDDYVLTKDGLDADPRNPLGEVLMSLALGGRAVGIHVVIATYSPTDLRVNTLGVFPHRVVLRTNDRSDYTAIDWRPSAEEVPPPVPGRGVVTGPVEVQIVQPDLSRIPQSRPAGAPQPVRRLPREVALATLGAHPDLDLIGVGGPNVAPVGIATEPGAHLLVLGAARTGRSTCLTTITTAALARSAERVAIIAPRRSPLTALAKHPQVVSCATTVSEVAETLAAAAAGATLLVIDDAEQLPSSAADRLDELMRESVDRGIRLVVAARPSDWTRSYDPWSRQLNAARRVLLLSDFRELATQFDVRPPTAMAPPAPGRGFLVADGTVTELQVAAVAPAPPR